MFAVLTNATNPFGPSNAGSADAAMRNGAQNAGGPASLTGPPRLVSDGVVTNFIRPAGQLNGGFAGPIDSGSAAGGGFFGLIQNLIGQLGTMLAQLNGEANAQGPTSQSVANATFASTGDPHLSERGTLKSGSGTTSIDNHFDSMTGHDNLLSSNDFAGGYRLSTTVTTPNTKGVTLNESATVHLNDDRDNVTLRNDGSYAIASDGQDHTLVAGQTLRLAGGAQVTRTTDGSLTIDEENSAGGSIHTTLAAQGGGVDATAAVQDAAVGGDIAANNAAASPVVRYSVA